MARNRKRPLPTIEEHETTPRTAAAVPAIFPDAIIASTKRGGPSSVRPVSASTSAAPPGGAPLHFPPPHAHTQPNPHLPQFQLVQPQLLPYHAYPPVVPQPCLIRKADGSPADPQTKWDELHCESQALLLQIEERMVEYRIESEEIDQCSRIHDVWAVENRAELDAKRIRRELEGLHIPIKRENAMAKEALSSLRCLMREMEHAIYSYELRRQRLLQANTREAARSGYYLTGTAASPMSTPQIIPNLTRRSSSHYSLPSRPSPYMRNKVTTLEQNLTKYRKHVEELEKAVQEEGRSSLQSLPNTLWNIHYFLISVASKLENLHEKLQEIKGALHARRRKPCGKTDPFGNSERRGDQGEASASRFHP